MNDRGVAVSNYLTDPTGRRVRFIAPLGRGGFGAVYLAEVRTPDGLLHKQAVKLLHANLELDDDLAARARDEARLMSQLHHDHVVQVYALTQLEKRWAVFMEYVQGIDAGALLSEVQGGLPPRVAVAMIERACAALDAAWNQPSPDTGRPLRVVHRDLKPANLMLSVEGSVKVMDFGVARADFEREAHTRSTQYGTGRYMAPERWLHVRAEHASDVYALGVTLWEMLTGMRFERMPLAPVKFDARLEELLAELGPERDPQGQLSSLLRGMLAFEDEQRPSARQAMEQLDELGEGLSGPSLRRYARRIVPPLLEIRQAELLADSQVWPGISGSRLVDSPQAPASGPTSEPHAEPSQPEPSQASPTHLAPASTPAADEPALVSQPTLVGPAGQAHTPTPSVQARAHKAAPPTRPPNSNAAPPQIEPPVAPVGEHRRLLWTAFAGVLMALALVAGGLVWATSSPPEPELGLEPIEPAELASPTVDPRAEEPIAEPELPDLADGMTVEEEERAPEPARTLASKPQRDPPPARSPKDPGVERPIEIKEKPSARVTIPAAVESEPLTGEPISVMFTADPMNGRVSYKAASAGPMQSLSLAEGVYSLTWRWEDGQQLTCTVRVTPGKSPVKFDQALERCR